MKITVEDMVRREVGHCVSALVSTLAQGNGIGSIAGKPLRELTEQAAELCYPVLDYEEAARQAGWTIGLDDTDEGTWGYSKGGKFARSISTEAEAARICCELNGIDPYEWEIFEHWIVSPWLAERLEAEGERVDRDFAGLCVWGRTCSGQGIASDGVMIRIHAAMTAPDAGVAA